MSDDDKKEREKDTTQEEPSKKTTTWSMVIRLLSKLFPKPNMVLFKPPTLKTLRRKATDEIKKAETKQGMRQSKGEEVSVYDKDENRDGVNDKHQKEGQGPDEKQEDEKAKESNIRPD
ncbi:MAG TPA: hypothetical protein QF353_02205 [Gammaproteobacteria bacterium]|nr:hypothetical protein [Gammaproteobacteria bacterium]